MKQHAEKIQQDHRRHEHQHRGGIRRGRYDRAATVIITIAYLKFFSKNFGGHDSEQRKNKNEQGSSNTRPSPTESSKLNQNS